MPQDQAGEDGPTSTERRCLEGRIALVTGSTSGIGLAIASALASSGCAVLTNGFCEENAFKLQISELAKKTGSDILFHPADMSQPEAIAALFEFAGKALGKPDIVINNAGIQHTDPIEQFPAEKWDAIIAINLSAAFHVIKHAVPGMKAGGWGRIINIASTHGLVASANKSAYVAAKHGLIGLTRSVALELAESGITVNAICPGWVRTPLVEKQIAQLADRERISHDEAAQKLLAAKQPSGRFVEVEEIAETACFICSPACSNMTGTTLAIDGGWTAQ